MSWLLYSRIYQVMWYFWVFIVNPFPVLWSLFFPPQKNCVSFGLLVSCLSLSQSAKMKYGKPTVGVFLKITSLSWMILSVSLDELNSIDWLLKSWWWIFLKYFLFHCCKRILIWQKNISGFLESLLNIIFWILLWMLTTLVIRNLNITVSTTLKYC